MPQFTLWYWVRDAPLSAISCVEVSSDINVFALQGHILESSRLNAAPQDVKVYRIPQTRPVSLAVEHQDVLGQLSMSDLGPSLRVAQKLASIFAPQPPEDHLHLIIDIETSTLKISCRIRGANVADHFSVRCPKLETLDALKAKAKELWPQFSSVSLLRLRLYKISFNNDDELQEILDQRGEGMLISERRTVQDVFNDVPFSSRMLEVVVEAPHQSNSPPSVLRPTGDGNIIQEARKTFLQDSIMEKPSSIAMPSSFLQRQATSTKAIPCGRPRSYEDCIPTTLLHPVFGHFIDDTKAIEVTPDDTQFVVDLANAMSALYADESQRVDKIKEVLQTYDVHLIITKTKTTEYETDGDISTQGHRYVIVEFKNEAGNTSGEPYFQTIGYYLESTRARAPNMPNSSLPCLLLSIFGPYMVFAAAAWNLRPTVQLLSMPIAFHVPNYDTENLLLLARHMAAFRKAIQRLKQYYESLQPPELFSGMSSPQLFPYPTIYTSLIDKTEKEFVYLRQLSKDKLVFFGFEDPQPEDRICIKFVRQYSVDAHQYCMSLECAPALRGFQALPGGWFMVVMDDLSDDHETLFNKPVSASTKEIIANKLAEFHEAGFVHGDIRDSNIMIPESDQTKFKIIDFDWAGRASEVKYPPFLNREIWRPPGASDGQLILADHDDDMLGRIGRWN